MTKRDYYEVLGVSRGADDADIKRAYRRLAKKHHPDQNKGDKKAEARFKEVQAAYDVLSDKAKRSRYDQFGHAGIDPSYGPGGGSQTWATPGGQTVDLGDLADLLNFGVSSGPGPRGGTSIFEEFFHGVGHGSRVRRAPPEPPRDIEHPVTLTFEQAVRGTTLELEVAAGGQRRRQRISVRVPPGVRDGQRIRVRGKGMPGGRGRKPGDLYVVCRVAQHAYFQRRGDDLFIDLPLNVTEAVLGAKVDLPTLDGVRTVTIPPGTAGGAKLRLAGLGVPSPKGSRRGDLFAVIKIVPPPRLNEKQRRLFEELSEINNGSPRDGLWKE